jgi:hypothetical protein
MNAFTLIGIIFVILIAIAYVAIGAWCITIEMADNDTPWYKAFPAGVIWPLMILCLWLANKL